jgi:eukaryotic-like serine/threonine-protein kinase
MPDIRGMKFEKVKTLLSDNNFSYEIDSVFLLDKPPGTVLEQDPEANTKVKSGRNIYVSVVSGNAPTIKLPDLKDLTLREATAMLKSYDLKVGELIYKPDLAKDAVLGVQYQGNVIPPGTNLKKGDVIDILLGDGLGEMRIVIPNLFNLSLDEARFILSGSSLSVGNIQYDESIKNDKDKMEAMVYAQDPAYQSDTLNITPGTPVNLYLTVDKKKIEQ